MPNTTPTQSTTQQFLDIYDITNDVIILKNGAASVVLTVNAINFGLLAEEEQDAVIYQYAALLNSLNFPIQVVVRSQTKDASTYLQLLKDREDQTTDRTKKEWISRYREFVGNLIYERNVLDKKFYVAIPASYLEMGLTTAQNLVSGFKESSIEGVEKSVILEKALNILEPRRDQLIAQFARIGLLARQLKTQEIIQLFYTSYNPEAAEGQQITDSRSYTTPLVQAQIRGVLMNDQPMTPSVTSAPATTTPEPTPMAAPTAPQSAPAPTPITPAMPSASAPMPTPMPAAAPMPSMPSMPSITESPVTSAPVAPAPVAAPAPTTPTMPITAPTQSPLPTPTMPKPSMPVAPMSAPAPAPMNTQTITMPTGMGTTPAASPMSASPVPATTPTTPAADNDPQALINSTLQELGSVPSATPATGSTEEEPAPDLSSVAPVTPSSGSPTTPNSAV